MDLLEGPIRHYAWGSTTAIPELLGRPETGRPMAELWLGAHPSGPALVGASRVPLDAVIAADPVAALGPDAATRFGELPFLFKVLSATAPLSLQAHPSADQAEAGFAREEASGIPSGAPHRFFPDPHHKPELICALSEFRALCGFRDPLATLAVLDTVATAALDPARAMLTDDPSPDALAAVLHWLLSLGADDGARLTRSVVDACGRGGGAVAEAERAVVVELAAHHPDDPAAVAALLLNLVVLQPGEALFLGAGNLHCYLGGTGVELMANSDNVVRGGLTEKPVDVAALLGIVDPAPTIPAVQRPALVDGVAGYEAPVPEFSLCRLELNDRSTIGPGPLVALCVDGVATVGHHALERGEALWLPAADGQVEIEGRATVYCAGLGPLPR